MSFGRKALQPDQTHTGNPPLPHVNVPLKHANSTGVHPASQRRVRVMALWAMAVEAT